MQKEIISFDIFDTMIIRDVLKPADVFFLMEKYCKEHSIPIPENFAENRIRAERLANSRAGGAASIYDIYSCLKDLTGTDLSNIIELEFDFEIGLCRPNKKTVSLFYKYLSQGRSVVLISDMYLPEDIIKKMLSKCGIEGYQKVYISACCGCTKFSGRLYDYVLKDLNISGKLLRHIGDNYKSDFIRPLSKGIKADLIYSPKRTFKDKLNLLSPENFQEYKTMSLFAERIADEMDFTQQMGCLSLGPLLFGFTQWLLRSVKKEGIQNVLFFSRDGYFLKKAFDTINDNPDIHSTYFYCSRRAFVIPMLWKCRTYKDLFDYLDSAQCTSVRKILVKTGLNPEEYSQRAEKYGIDIDKNYSSHSLETNEAVAAFIEDILPEIKRMSLDEFKSVTPYLKSFSSYKKTAVVDIGWCGHIQNGLERMLDELSIESEITGYYLGLASDSGFVRNKRINASGFLYDQTHGKYAEDLVDAFFSVLESSLLASHGSVKRFMLTDDNTAIPVFKKHEYDDPEGKLCDEISIIQEFQLGALTFVREFHNSLLSKCIVFSPEISLYNFARLGNIPTLREVNVWGNIRFFDIRKKYIALPELKGFPKFKNSAWKVGCMKRLCKLPFRYDRIFRLYMAYQKN